jgi:hypothetical protein
MANERSESVAHVLGQERLNQLIEELGQEGHSQVEMAMKANLPPQYLSDVKRGRRPMTELVARRISDVFAVNHEWLLGQSDAKNVSPQKSGEKGGPALWLPLFPHPIEGEPSKHAAWDGSSWQVTGLAAVRAASAHRPYLLRFGNEDHLNRLQKGDVLLMTQAADECSQISVVRQKGKSYLARLDKNEKWIRLATGESLEAGPQVTGHCIGIVWSLLMRDR